MLGLKRGIIAELLTLIGLLSAIFVAVYWYADLSSFLIRQFKWSQIISNIFSFIIIFIMVIIIFRVIENILCRICNLLLLNWINNLGGAVFGFIRGTIIIGLLLLILNIMPLPLQLEYQISQSLLSKYFINIIILTYNSIKEWLPLHFQIDIDFLNINEHFFEKIT